MKAFIFDMDGVIFNTESLWKDGFNKANKLFNISLTEEYRKSICGKSEELIRAELKAMYPSMNVEEYREYTVKYVNEEVMKGNFKMKDGFLALIKELKQKGYKIALATSSTKARAYMLFEKKGLNLDDYFDSKIFAENVGKKSKPDPYMFLLSAKNINVDPSDAYIIEDSLNGIEAAYNGGFKPVMVIDLIEPNDFAKKNCYNIYNNLDELRLDLLK